MDKKEPFDVFWMKGCIMMRRCCCWWWFWAEPIADMLWGGASFRKMAWLGWFARAISSSEGWKQALVWDGTWGKSWMASSSIWVMSHVFSMVFANLSDCAAASGGHWFHTFCKWCRLWAQTSCCLWQTWEFLQRCWVALDNLGSRRNHVESDTVTAYSLFTILTHLIGTLNSFWSIA